MNSESSASAGMPRRSFIKTSGVAALFAANPGLFIGLVHGRDVVDGSGFHHRLEIAWSEFEYTGPNHTYHGETPGFNPPNALKLFNQSLLDAGVPGPTNSTVTGSSGEVDVTNMTQCSPPKITLFDGQPTTPTYHNDVSSISRRFIKADSNMSIKASKFRVVYWE